MSCGKYMAASVGKWIACLETHGELPGSISGRNKDIASEIKR